MSENSLDSFTCSRKMAGKSYLWLFMYSSYFYIRFRFFVLCFFRSYDNNKPENLFWYLNVSKKHSCIDQITKNTDCQILLWCTVAYLNFRNIKYPSTRHLNCANWKLNWRLVSICVYMFANLFAQFYNLFT